MKRRQGLAELMIAALTSVVLGVPSVAVGQSSSGGGADGTSGSGTSLAPSSDPGNPGVSPSNAGDAPISGANSQRAAAEGTIEGWQANWTRGGSFVNRDGVVTYTPGLLVPRAAAPGFAVTQSSTIGFVLRASVLVRTATGQRKVRYQSFKQEGIPDPVNFLASFRASPAATGLLRASIRRMRPRTLPVVLELVFFTADGVVKSGHTFQARVTP